MVNYLRPLYYKIIDNSQYETYCGRLEWLCQYEPENEIEIRLLTALIEQYDDYCDMKRNYKELIMRSNLCLPAEEAHITYFDEGLTQEYLYKVLKYCVEENEKL